MVWFHLFYTQEQGKLNYKVSIQDSYYFWGGEKNKTGGGGHYGNFLWCPQFPVSLSRVAITLVFTLWNVIERYIHFCVLSCVCVIIHNKKKLKHLMGNRCLSKYAKDNYFPCSFPVLFVFVCLFLLVILI